MKIDTLSREHALKLTCLKTQITLVRNVADYPFPTRNATGPTPPLNQWLEQLAAVHPFEDLTGTDFAATASSCRYGLADTEDQGPAYRLLEFTVTEGDVTHTVFCELMAGNHFTFSMTGPEIDFTERIAFLERFVDRFAPVFNFAYDEQFGYLTTLPTMTGTGLRIRSWMHLPGLSYLDYLRQMVQTAEVKGIFTEYMPGEEPPPGDLFIFFNRFSLNLPLATIVRDYQTFLFRLAKQEIKARMRLAYDRVEHLYDEVIRMRLIAGHSNLIAEREALNLLSSYYIACTTGAIKPINLGFEAEECFDVVRDALHLIVLPKVISPTAIQTLPAVYQQLSTPVPNPDVLRALWCRKLAKVKFTPQFLRRVNRQ